ncbi:MAG: class I poly(R)-hydroxyalkanoic acid synthase [Burkholderiales bacterium]|nr:class I poly(R)-hydroxyalkanoic acid synthase [Burkholderiales bacterium]
MAKTNSSPKRKTPPSPQPGPLGDNAQAFGQAVGDAFKSMAGMSLPLQDLTRLQQHYLQEMTQLWNQALGASEQPAPLKDRRFSAQAWAQNPMAAFTARAYLLNARTLMEMAEAVEADAKTKARVRFAVQQWIDAASPSNFLALNPEAQQKAIESQGQSIAKGLEQLLADIRQGHMSQTDETVFEVGRNVATTEGTVVFENELMQLIEYKPLTAQVHERPILFVPPCINKYYILDLQPDNSVIRYTVEQGHRLFVVSWRNPDESLAAKTWDDYIAEGPLKAIEVVQDITGQAQFNMLGFCVGGTILTTALAVLAARGQQPASSVTLLTTLLDFSDTGILDIFVDEPMVQMREMTIGAEAPSGPGLLKGGELAATFSFLRPNDLVWNYVVGNYLKGETPPPFDLLYWNSDSTNLPGPMYCWYLRHLYLQNELRIPGRLTTCGESVDVGAIKAPFYLYASREDHIVPWDAAYRSTQMIKGKKRFVMGASGHIAGVINPPAKGKRHYWTHDRLVESAQGWLDAAREHPGSWWTDWSDWLASHAGKKVAAPKSPGNRQHKPIEPAPGRYVKEKA